VEAKLDGTLPASPALALEHVTKRFHTRNGVVVALADCCLEARAGEALALVGPNGAGKSTALRVAAGLVRADAGAVRRAATAGAMLDGAAALYPRLTVRENAEYFGVLNGLAPREARVRAGAALERFGVASRAGELFQKLSRGLRQRVAIACHVVHGPGVLLLDEPTLGIDREFHAAVVELLREVLDAGTALVLATHDRQLVRALATRVALLRHGAVEGWLDPSRLPAFSDREAALA
jgi:ABC-2 type transport system ATP-binding protein